MGIHFKCDSCKYKYTVHNTSTTYGSYSGGYQRSSQYNGQTNQGSGYTNSTPGNSIRQKPRCRDGVNCRKIKCNRNFTHPKRENWQIPCDHGANCRSNNMGSGCPYFHYR